MKKLIIVLAILAVLCGIGYGGYEYVKADFPRFCEESVPIFAYHRWNRAMMTPIPCRRKHLKNR